MGVAVDYCDGDMDCDYGANAVGVECIVVVGPIMLLGPRLWISHWG